MNERKTSRPKNEGYFGRLDIYRFTGSLLSRWTKVIRYFDFSVANGDKQYSPARIAGLDSIDVSLAEGEQQLSHNIVRRLQRRNVLTA